MYLQAAPTGEDQMINALTAHRIAQKLHYANVPLAPRIIRKLSQLLFSSYVGLQAEIGEGTELAYGGLGIVIHPAAKLTWVATY